MTIRKITFEMVSAVWHPQHYAGSRPVVRPDQVPDHHWHHVQREGDVTEQYHGLLRLVDQGELIRNVELHDPRPDPVNTVKPNPETVTVSRAPAHTRARDDGPAVVRSGDPERDPSGFVSAPVDGLLAWLRARLDDEERRVKGSGDLGWLTYRQVDGSMDHTEPASLTPDGVTWVAGGIEATGFASAVVVHREAYVLADIASKRRLLDLHHPDGELENWYWLQRKCAECGGMWHRWIPDKLPTEIGPEVGCLTVRLLALPYADQLGYREEWRP